MRGGSRRELLAALAAYPLLHVLMRARALGKTAGTVESWLRELCARCADLKRGVITPIEWQDEIARLHARVTVEEVLRFIDFDRLVHRLRYEDDVGTIVEVPLPKIAGVPAGFAFGHKLFCYRRGAATPPHVHNNVVSAHWIVRGSVRTRTFDRVRDEPGCIVVSPARDEISRVGRVVTMSDARDNGHWFVGDSSYSCSFDVAMSDVIAGKRYATAAQDNGIIWIDPTVRCDRSGVICAPVLSFDGAVAKFGGKPS